MLSTNTIKRHKLPARDIDVIDHVNVLVIGGGPAGIGAAYGAGKFGAKTAVIERYGYLGGMATSALVGPFMTCYSCDGKQRVIGGVFYELVERLVQMGGAIDPAKVFGGSPETSYWELGHDHVTPFDSEVLKHVLDNMMVEAGVKLYFHTSFVEPIKDGQRVCGAIIHSKSGLQAILADVIVDCSSDADVAYQSGVPCEKGRKKDGFLQPMTMFFQIGNVDDEKFIDFVEKHPEYKHPFLHDIVNLAMENGDFTFQRGQVGLYRSIYPGVWRVNTSRILGLDGTNRDDLSKAEVEGRRQVFEVLRFFKKYLPGFENAILWNSGSQIGIRETRRIVGEYVLTASDLIEAKEFTDTIALAGYPMDIHTPTTVGGGLHETANIYEIPFRTLVPKVVDGLLVAGRCISATHEAAGAIRTMPTCYTTGHAAGVGAALSSKLETEPRNIDVKEVQSTLISQKAILPTRFSE